MQLPTKQVAQKVFDAHLDLIWEAMKGQITDLEEFNEWATKMAAAHTSTTLAFLFPHDLEAQQLNDEIINLDKYGFYNRTEGVDLN